MWRQTGEVPPCCLELTQPNILSCMAIPKTSVREHLISCEVEVSVLYLLLCPGLAFEALLAQKLALLLLRKVEVCL